MRNLTLLWCKRLCSHPASFNMNWTSTCVSWGKLAMRSWTITFASRTGWKMWQKIAPPPPPLLPPLPVYHHNGFLATHALEHIMCSYRLLVPMNQGVLNKLCNEHNISGHKWSTTHRGLKSHRIKMSVIYMQSWKQCALPVITTMALWQLIHLGTWWTVTHCWHQWAKEYSTSYARSIM